MFIVYVLRSLKTGRIYIGHTKNLPRRQQEHNTGKTKSLRYIRPLEVIYTEQYPIKIEASRRELELKTGKGREWLHNLLS